MISSSGYPFTLRARLLLDKKILAQNQWTSSHPHASERDIIGRACRRISRNIHGVPVRGVGA